MCMQCVAEGGTYVAGAVGALQIMKVRAAARRRGGAPVPGPTPPKQPVDAALAERG